MYLTYSKMYLTYIKKVECHSAHSKCEICLHKGTETQSLECIHFFSAVLFQLHVLNRPFAGSRWVAAFAPSAVSMGLSRPYLS